MKIYRDPNIVIEVSPGQIFAIALEANLTTGFAWARPEEYDESKIKVIEKEPRSSSELQTENNIMVGESREQIFEFEAIKTGKLEIKMHYKRDWESKSRDEKTFQVHIKPKK